MSPAVTPMPMVGTTVGDKRAVVTGAGARVAGVVPVMNLTRRKNGVGGRIDVTIETDVDIVSDMDGDTTVANDGTSSRRGRRALRTWICRH
ncbi:hypothetical protein PI125_g9439 [Phytophthora idaei]|nr:hypothetical protein PI125_g9439 [Phytophthora idaei]KAG3156434.1 hypothetical protein PI126_g8760 [Phytophthora idaei]